MTQIAHSLGLEVLLEMHSLDHMDKNGPPVFVGGENHRNLENFNIYLGTAMDKALELLKESV